MFLLYHDAQQICTKNSENCKKKTSESVKKLWEDPEHKERIVAAIQPDIPIPPMTESPIGLNQFISDGDLWTEAD